MKILLDEQLPVKLKYRFDPLLIVLTVKDLKWLGMKDQQLFVKIREEKFDVFVTNDRNLKYQVNRKNIHFTFIDLDYTSNRYEDLIAIVQALNHALVISSPKINSTQNDLIGIFTFTNQSFQEFMHL